MENYLKFKLLEREEVDGIVECFSDCTWTSGRETGGHKEKTNIEMDRCSRYTDLDNKFVRYMMDNPIVYDNTVSTNVSNTLFSIMEVGGKYPLHTDAAFLGHYSMTTFLNDPDEYEGGELILSVNGEKLSVKLEKGHTILYLTGTPHAVTEITKGTRKVAVNWVTSGFPDPAIRSIYIDLLKIRNYYDELEDADENFDISDLEYDEHVKHPAFLAKKARQEMLRVFHSEAKIGRHTIV